MASEKPIRVLSVLGAKRKNRAYEKQRAAYTAAWIAAHPGGLVEVEEKPQ